MLENVAAFLLQHWQIFAALLLLVPLLFAIATATGRRILVRVAGSLWGLGFRLLTKVCVGIERVLVALLRPASRDGGISLGAGSAWAAGNGLVLASLLFLPASPYPTAAAGAFAALHGLIVLTGLLVVNEESDVMDGIRLRAEKDFAENSPARTMAVLSLSVLFLVAGAAGLFYRLDAVHGLQMTTSMPSAACEAIHCKYALYLLVTVEQMPGAEWVVGSHHVIFQGRWGHAYQGGVHLSATLLIFAVFIALFKQYKQIRSIMVALDERTDKEDINYLHMRASRAPAYIKRWIAFFAVNHPNPITRKRMLALVRRQRIFSFLPASLYRLHEEGNKLKVDQLSTIEDFLEASTSDIDNVILRSTLAHLRYQVEKQWASHGEAARNRLDRLTVALSKLALERKLDTACVPRKRLIDIAVRNPQDLGKDAILVAEEVDPITLCDQLLKALARLPEADRPKYARYCAAVISRKGSSWKDRQLDRLKRRAGQVKRAAANDNQIRIAMDDVASELIRARARRESARKAPAHKGAAA